MPPASSKVLTPAATAKRQRDAVGPASVITTQVPAPQRSGLLLLIGALVLLALAVVSTSLMRALMRMTRES
ncbi:MAG TPA: hypothetical protein VMD09_04225 [Solirubrobacteraceae bacterium]|nr:hypothetical protein [Solirubrobacteraceae bacterium]